MKPHDENINITKPLRLLYPWLLVLGQVPLAPCRKTERFRAGHPKLSKGARGVILFDGKWDLAGHVGIPLYRDR